MKPEVAFGNTLRRLRLEKGISQEKLALMSDLDRTYISLLERGLRQPSLKTILRLSKTLEISGAQMLMTLERLIDENPTD